MIATFIFALEAHQSALQKLFNDLVNKILRWVSNLAS
jgi:hypothetical protein